MIKAVNLARSYRVGEVTIDALRPTSIEVAQGEFVAITGPSGAGKSTLLYQLGLLDNPSEGTVFIEDADTSLLSEAEKTKIRLNKLGYVFQDYSLLPELSAHDNVAVLLLMLGMSKKEAYEKAAAVLERLGLGARKDNFPSQLSGGEQQRVSIARAVAHDPVALLADEPTANLDSQTSQQVINYLFELNRNGQTILMVTHEQEYSERARRIITLRDGAIVSDTLRQTAQQSI